MKIGVVLAIEQVYEELGPMPRYQEVRALALQAERLGFDSLWMGDHLLFRNFEMTPHITGTYGAWESMTVLTALAETTNTVRMGPWVLCTPLRNPAVLAKQAVTMDEVSDGRFILGLGSGWNRPVFDAFGVPFDHRVDRLEEALQIIAPLLREGRVDFQGKYYSAPECEIVPRGPSPQGPPILIAAEQPRMLRLAARYGDMWNKATGYQTIPNNYDELLGDMGEACAAVGRDPKTLQITVRNFMAFPEAGPIPEMLKELPLQGVDRVAEMLRAYADLGCALAHCQIYPLTEAGLENLAEATQKAGLTLG